MVIAIVTWFMVTIAASMMFVLMATFNIEFYPKKNKRWLQNE